MAIIEFRSSERAHEVDTIYPPCCGLTPQAFQWRRKKFVFVECRNPACENYAGVLAYDEKDMTQRWEQFRVKGDTSCPNS